MSNTSNNIVVNGGFEAGLSGWTLTGATDYTSPSSEPHDGSSDFHAGSVGSDSVLTQTLSTQPGQSYTLDFWLANEGGPTNDFSVHWNGQTLKSLSDAQSFGYTEYSFDVQATGSSSTLYFTFRQDPSWWDLDDVTVNSKSSPYPDGVENNPHARIAPDTTNVSPDLLSQLSDIRDAYRSIVGDDATLYINSGTEGDHRPNSQHYLGRALDFQLPVGFTNDERVELVEALRDVLPGTDRIGLSTRDGQSAIDGANFKDNPPGHIHIDLGRQAPNPSLSAALSEHYSLPENGSSMIAHPMAHHLF